MKSAKIPTHSFWPEWCPPCLGYICFPVLSWCRWKGTKSVLWPPFLPPHHLFQVSFREGIPLYPAETGPHAWRDSSLKNRSLSVCAHACSVLIQAHPEVSWWNHFNPLPVPFWAKHKYWLQKGLVCPMNVSEQLQQTGPSGTENAETLFLYFLDLQIIWDFWCTKK